MVEESPPFLNGPKRNVGLCIFGSAYRREVG